MAEPRTVVALSSHGYVQWSKPELRWVARDGSQRPIATLAGPHTLGQAWPVGQYVAFQSAPSAEQNLGGGVLYLWDSTRRSRPVKVYESDDELPFDAVSTVTTSDTQLSWLHPRKDGRREVRLYDVATGKTDVVHVGFVDQLVLTDRLLVWSEASVKDGPTRLVAVDLATDKPTDLPPPLAQLRDPQEMSTDGRTFAWVTMDLTKLMVWRQGWPAARLIVENTEGNPVTWPKVSGDTVSWVDERTWTADVRSGSYVPMTKRWGGAEGWGRFLHIGLPKGAGASFHLDTSKLPPLPRCS